MINLACSVWRQRLWSETCHAVEEWSVTLRCSDGEKRRTFKIS